jgi:hypothetical protein
MSEASSVRIGTTAASSRAGSDRVAVRTSRVSDADQRNPGCRPGAYASGSRARRVLVGMRANVVRARVAADASSVTGATRAVDR